MRRLVASALALASMFVGYFAFTAESSGRPANVDAANWIQVTETVGFVVIPEKKSGRVATGGVLLEPAASGYFMAKTPSGWRRLVVVEPIKGPGTAG